MWPFGNRYDILVVDYKVVIRENLTYNKTRVIGWGVIVLSITLLGFIYNENPPSTEISLLILLIEIGIFIWAYFTQRSNCMIEIDNDAKTIRVREKYDIDPNQVTCIKVLQLHGKGSNYIYDYLALISDSDAETGIHKILRGSISNKEIANIAHLIAEKLNLELIIETPELPSFRDLFSWEKTPKKE